MKYFCSIIILVAASFANAQDNLVAIDYHSTRIQNSHFKVKIDGSGHLVLTTYSLEGKHLVTSELTEKELLRVKKQLALVDWSIARKDKISLLDGTLVRIAYGGKKVHLSSPGYHSRQRGIGKLQKTIEQIFKLAGLDKNGMPQQSSGKPTK